MPGWQRAQARGRSRPNERSDKGKPLARAGRKATGLRTSSPGCHRCHSSYGPALITLLTALLLVPAAGVAEGKKHRVKATAAQECANADLEATRTTCPRSAPRSSASTTRSAPRTACRRCARTSGCARPRSATRATWSRTRYFEHTTPEGVTMVDRILRASYVREDEGWVLGENLAWGTGSFGTPRGAARRLDGRRPATARTSSSARSARWASASCSACRSRTPRGATYTVDFGVRR